MGRAHGVNVRDECGQYLRGFILHHEGLECIASRQNHGLGQCGPDNVNSIATYAFFILCLMFPWPIYALAVSDGENLPRVCIQPAQHSHEVNLGKLHCNLISGRTFLIENASGNDWKVQKVKSGCDCVKPSIAQETEVPSKPDCFLTVNCAVLPQSRAGKFEVPIALVDGQDNVLCEIVVKGIHHYSFDVKEGGMLLSTPKTVSGMSEEVILTRNFDDDDVSKVKWRLLQSSIDGVAVVEVARTEWGQDYLLHVV